MMPGAPALPERNVIADALGQVREAIVAAAKQAGRDPRAVTLIAVSKTVGPAVLEAALAAGQRTFGENRVQEARAKWPALRERYPDIELHLIGPLQSNKVKEAVALFDVIHTVDRPRLSAALSAEIDRQGRHPGLFIEINTGAEPQKAGVLPQDAEAFIALCRERDRLDPQGLMCIPPIGEPPGPHFALLAKIAARHGLPLLSMGMSADFELAIAFGATHVRVGTAIFGARPPIQS
ncbi:MAG TPA: YggS family pyridoxal phosphate-dependent enzyme [Xanthobacteraceae bacterium]|nr:YggS family pyridoxal phosphate-dependent enzyme [Xanthobacteraceae bacterium]